MKLYIMAVFIMFNIASLCWTDIYAGVGKRVVTPDPLLPVSGGIGPSTPATRKFGDLWVRAMVLEKDDTRVAIVGADFLGFPKVLGDQVRKKVKGIPPENIIIGATHTHSAPDMYGFPDEEGNFSIDMEYVEGVCEQMAHAVNEAVDNLQPVVIKIATGEAQEGIAYNYYAPDLYDPRCDVIQALGRNNKPVVTLVNYAVHPEVFGSRRGICSPDMIGPFYEYIEEKTGGMAIFMNGAQGGMVTADNRNPGTGEENHIWEECQRIGNLLAKEALKIINDAEIQENPRLECYARTFTFPMDSELLRMILEISPLGYEANPDGSAPTQVNLINLGNARILTIPGEALPNIGYYLKRKMHGDHNFLFGLTNDAFGYILTKVDWNSFKRYDYISKTCLGEMTGEIFIEEALKFADEHP
ncbi:hypothetical protein GF312_21225 [Candidatus Poribacteria bacterium]|nr:hypothetical protein [Candidatus Poribacteria bacterium]